jgi:two-component system OmpR family sensor kinase
MCSPGNPIHSMFDSVRVRLTIWYVGLLSLLLIAFSAGVYALLWRNFYERADGILQSVATGAVTMLGKELSESGLDELAAREAMETLNLPDDTLAIFDADGGLLAEKPAGSAERMALDRDLPQDGNVHLYTVRARGGDRELRRVAAVRVTLEPLGRTYTVATSRSLTPLHGELARDRYVLLVAVPLGLLLVGCGGWFLSRKSLAPVLAMSEQARRIGAENIDERLPVVNPRDELGRLADTFNALLSRLSLALAQQRQFMADASHELRTPLSVIRTATSVTLRKERRGEDEYREALCIVDEESRRLSRIVEDMFRLARADAARLTVQPALFYLDELLSETARAARLLGASKNMKVDISQLPESPCVGDEDLLRQMVMNLLDNAIKYTPAGGMVEVKLAQANGSYLLSISDTGPGIPDDAQSQVFERFYRVNKTRSRAESAGGAGAGAGLGLAIARAIAEAHGGSLTLESSGAGGSTFAAAIPSRVADAATI